MIVALLAIKNTCFTNKSTKTYTAQNTKTSAWPTLTAIGIENVPTDIRTSDSKTTKQKPKQK